MFSCPSGVNDSNVRLELFKNRSLSLWKMYFFSKFSPVMPTEVSTLRNLYLSAAFIKLIGVLNQSIFSGLVSLLPLVGLIIHCRLQCVLLKFHPIPGPIEVGFTNGFILLGVQSIKIWMCQTLFNGVPLVGTECQHLSQQIETGSGYFRK